jgi:hypothetical protein
MLQRGTRNLATVSRINHRLRSIRAATRAWQRDQISAEKNQYNINHAIQYFDAVEEWHPLYK